LNSAETSSAPAATAAGAFLNSTSAVTAGTALVEKLFAEHSA
jgi:hypothetical protein